MDDFRLADWTVYPPLGRITREGETVHLQPRVMDVLVYLSRQPGKVLSKEEILDAVWPDEFVANSVLTRAMAVLRRALGDDARSPRYIETISKRGYRVGAQVEPVASGAAAPSQADTAAAPAAATVTTLPLAVEELPEELERPVFVARESELEQLDGLLASALCGKGSVAFVTGEAGTGKTALVGEFSRRAQSRHEDLVVATGMCNAATGAGDPYAPWRQILAQLTGDVEVRLRSGLVTRDQAQRLWRVVPAVAETISTSARDLVETLVPGAGLLSRAEAAAPDAESLAGLRQLVERKLALPPDVSLQQAAVFMQVSRLLRAVAERAPLLLMLEDLHWTDAGSVGVLFHLGRELAGSRLLVVGTYRPEEVTAGGEGDRHPLALAIPELQRLHGDTSVGLDRSSDRSFVDAFIDSEDNRLDESFRETLHEHTRGHALFTVELLRAMQDRGMLVPDEAGAWTAGESLEWGALPARVEGVIAARLERLSGELRDLLTIASAEGEEFRAEVIARVHDADTREIVRLLSRELETRHRLVSARGVRALGAGRLSVFGFSHVLFQRYLYGTLNEAERVQLHEDVAFALEQLYGENREDIAPQLARHFEEAGLIDRAIRYLHQAGVRATRMTANQEAIGHLERALDLLGSLPAGADRDRLEFTLQVALHAPLISTQGWGGADVGAAAERAFELGERLADNAQRLQVMLLLASYCGSAGDLPRALAIGEQMLELAEALGDDHQIFIAHWTRGWTLLYSGKQQAARHHLEWVVERYDCDRHHWMAYVYGQDPGAACLTHLTWTLLSLGYLDQAACLIEAALELAPGLVHPLSNGFATAASSIPGFESLDSDRAEDTSRLLRVLAEEHGLPVWLVVAQWTEGVGLLAAGRGAEAEAAIREALDITGQIGFKIWDTYLLSWYGLAAHAAGATSDALAAFDEALRGVTDWGEHAWEAKIHLHRGIVLRDNGGAGRRRAELTGGDRHRPRPAGQALRAAGRHRPRPPVAGSGQTPRGPRAARPGLRLVHRRARHGAAGRGEGAAQGVRRR